MPIRVLTIDDSPLFRELLSMIVASEPDFQLAGSACDGREGVEKVLELSPDVVTLDVEMPVMDGLATLQRIMLVKPTPVIMVSSHTRRASATTVRALQLGACDFVTKPEKGLGGGFEELRRELVEKIAALGASEGIRGAAPPFPQPGINPLARFSPPRKFRIVVMGGSTGGTAVLTRILGFLPDRMDATVIAIQHLPAAYTAEFARRLRETVPCHVREASDGELIEPGTIFVAPGGSHLTVYGNRLRVEGGEPVKGIRGVPLEQGIRGVPPEHGHRPSIDVTMRSIARRFGSDVCGVLLTGIGRDGTEGIGAIKDAGGFTIAQDEATSVVYGMPKSAVASGKVDAVLSDIDICKLIAEVVKK